MRTLNNKNRIDGFNESVENALGMKAKKMPWHLRFAPGAILRQSGLITVLAVVALILLNDGSAADALKETHYYEKFGEIGRCATPR